MFRCCRIGHPACFADTRSTVAGVPAVHWPPSARVPRVSGQAEADASRRMTGIARDSPSQAVSTEPAGLVSRFGLSKAMLKVAIGVSTEHRRGIPAPGRAVFLASVQAAFTRSFHRSAAPRSAPSADAATRVSIAKFAKPRGTLSYELRNERGTSTSMVLVPLLNPKFATG